jgi:hypothetical protein
VGKDLHRTLAVEALRAGQSLNSYCVHVLRQQGARAGSTSPRRRSRRPSGDHQAHGRLPCDGHP